jgi:hypothetical protein
MAYLMTIIPTVLTMKETLKPRSLIRKYDYSYKTQSPYRSEDVLGLRVRFVVGRYPSG